MMQLLTCLSDFDLFRLTRTYGRFSSREHFDKSRVSGQAQDRQDEENW